MAKQKRKEWNQMSKAEKTIGLVGVAIVAFVALAVLSGIIGAISGSSNSSTDRSKEATKTEQKAENQPTEQTKEQPKARTISQSDAENVCQDANFLQNYISLNDTSIVTLSYNPTFTDMGDGTKSLQWNGKDKPSNSNILFVCDVALKGDKVEVQYLAIDGDTVYEQ